MPLFSFTLSFHELQSSPPSFNTKVACFLQGPQITRQFWCTGMQRSSKAQTAAVWLLYFCKTTSLSTSSKWKMLYLSSTGVDWILTLSLETVFTKSTNNQSLKMTAPAPCQPLMCVELEYILDPLLILFMGNSSTSSIDVIPGPIAPILLELRFANWGLRRIFPLKTK